MKTIMVVAIVFTVGLILTASLVRGYIRRQGIVDRGYDWAAARHASGVMTLKQIDETRRNSLSESRYGRAINRGMQIYLKEHGYYIGMPPARSPRGGYIGMPPARSPRGDHK